MIAAVGIYFWAAGLTTKQPTPETPVPIIANPIGNGKVLIANLGQKTINTSTLRPSDPNLSIKCESPTLNPGEQTLCTIMGTPSSNTIAIWGNGTGSATIPINPERVDYPPQIESVTDDGYGKNLINESLHINASVTDDIGVSTVLLEYQDTSGSKTNITMTSLGNELYTATISSSSTGTISYRVWANDTSNQWVKSDWRSVEYVEPGLADTPWPMFHHDLNHTGLSPYVGSSTNNTKWNFTTGGAVKSSPAIGPDGTIYVGSYDYHLYAMNPDGTLKWKFRAESGISSSPAIGTDGTIYVGSFDNNLYAINPDGTEKWHFTTGYVVWSSPAIGPDGTIYVGSNDGNLYTIH